MGTKKEMTLVAAEKPQLKKRAARDWSVAKAEDFLTVLAETCNVSEACRRTKVKMTVAYRRRKMDAAFRAAWNDAIAVGYSRLEMMLLDRAFNGVEKVIKRRDGTEERMMEYSNQLGLRLLSMHRETAKEADADADFSTEDADEIRERLVRKLQRMKKRDEQEEEQGRTAGSDASRDAADVERAGARATEDHQWTDG